MRPQSRHDDPPWATPHDVDRPRLRPSRSHHGYRHLALLARQLRAEVSIASPSLTIDLGCGSAPYRELFDGGYVGLDLTSSHGRPHAIAWAEATPLVQSCADLVLSTQQLEHVRDPVGVLREAARILQPGGTLLLSTHGVWPHHPDPHDYWRWTEEGLVQTVEDAGLTVQRVHRQGELFTTAISLATYPIGGLRRRGGSLTRTVAALILALLNSICAPLDWLLTRRGSRHYASPSYLVVAIRPEF
ncbi:methyltransferase domain-containing protein [Acidimicrobiia bacterium EGI L10123]|uniref:class I SAM-dependent methyltransferase n=1 Tax=Salinilacustrithrix flava TaxID=2957203 RepID=UPI003D7C310E|nr:methyltransferase domain-containing protein [Acidimicrobiia bacterium EGI L10123]